MTVTTGDGRTLHDERAGSGTPTVVFESGMGGSRAMWGAVLPAVAARTSTVVYDRSGLGRSPAAPGPRGLDELVADHLDVLASVDGPVVLVGHSWGGPIVRVAASRVPDRVVGVVLVDQTEELCDLFFTPKNRSRTAMMMRTLPTIGRLGLFRIPARRLARHLPEPHRSAMRAEDGTAAAVATQVAEVARSIDDLRELRDDPPALPDVPVTVISGTARSRLEPKGQRDDLVVAHRRRAEGLPQGRWVEAARSSHMVPFTEPDLVATEVLRLVDQAR